MSQHPELRILSDADAVAASADPGACRDPFEGAFAAVFRGKNCAGGASLVDPLGSKLGFTLDGVRRTTLPLKEMQLLGKKPKA